MTKRVFNNLLLFGLLIASLNVYAQDSDTDTSDSEPLASSLNASDVEKVDWADLSYEERQVLQQLESRWDNLSPERQRRLQRGANRWQQMQPRERAQAQQQQQRFRDMPLRQKQLINQRFQRFNSLNRQEQIRLRTIQRRFQNLSAEQRQRLREQFEQQSGTQLPTRQNDSSDTISTDETQQRIQDVIRQNRDVLRPITRQNNVRRQPQNNQR